jgi:diguanylate cyclase (GGDEF)-like protein
MSVSLRSIGSRAKNASAGLRGGLGSSHLLSLLPELLAVCGIVGLIWFGIWITLVDQRGTAAKAAVRDTSNLARAFEENTERIIAGADQILLSMRAEYEREGHGFDLLEWARTQAPPDRLTAQMAVIDRNGIALASTAGNAGVSVADRQHFLFQKHSAGDDIYVSQPVFGRSSHRWSIQITRKMLDKKGEFDGIVVLSVDGYDLSQFYQTLDLQQGFIALLGLDGVVRARAPVVPHGIGAAAPELLAAAKASPSPQGSFRLRGTDDPDFSTISFRQVRSYPLIVMVGFADSQVFAHFRMLRMWLLICGGAASVMVLLFGAIWLDQRKRALLSRRALTLTLESMSEGIVMVDAAGQVPVINRRAIELLRLPEDILTGLKRGSRRVAEHSAAQVLRALANCLPVEPAREATFMHADGTLIEGHRRLLADGGMLQTIAEVTERRLAENRIRHMAHHDHLTGLGNRVLFAEQIGLALERAAHDATPFALLCLDLDGFKQINDTFGHDIGDDLLLDVATRLTDTVGPTDFVARIGGDEFLVLSQFSADAEAAKRLAWRIVDSITRPFQVAAQQLSISICVGIAICPEHGSERRTLFKHADLALYCAKAAMEVPVRVFEPHMAASRQERLLLESDLRGAVAGQRLDVHFQPQFHTANMAVVGFEALVRWTDPLRGAIRPDIFIPIAEEIGLIIPIGRYVLEQACRAAAAWPDALRVGVNVSPVQFRDAGLPTMVAEVLARTGLAPRRLELEVTEGVLIADERQALRTLQALRKLGVAVALDDFGTGYASMSYLRRFPFDRIKLDRSFVQSQVNEPRARAILDCILMLTQRLDVGVIAEGVETQEQLEILRGQGCQEVQGFLVGRPMPETAVVAFLRDDRHALTPST